MKNRKQIVFGLPMTAENSQKETYVSKMFKQSVEEHINPQEIQSTKGRIYHRVSPSKPNSQN